MLLQNTKIYVFQAKWDIVDTDTFAVVFTDSNKAFQ
jgi:hypothetical protein